MRKQESSHKKETESLLMSENGEGKSPFKRNREPSHE